MVRPNGDVFFWATVQSVSPLTVRRDGETAPMGVSPSVLVDPAMLRVGDRVWCHLHHRRALILGVAGGALVGPWVDLPILNRAFPLSHGIFQARSTPYGIQFKGGIGAESTSSTAAQYRLSSLPAGMRPQQDAYLLPSFNPKSRYGDVIVEPNGDIRLRYSETGSYNQLNFDGLFIPTD